MFVREDGEEGLTTLSCLTAVCQLTTTDPAQVCTVRLEKTDKCTKSNAQNSAKCRLPFNIHFRALRYIPQANPKHLKVKAAAADPHLNLHLPAERAICKSYNAIQSRSGALRTLAAHQPVPVCCWIRIASACNQSGAPAATVTISRQRNKSENARESDSINYEYVTAVVG